MTKFYIYVLYMLFFYILIEFYISIGNVYDHTYVLFTFTGLAGVIYFLLDIQQPHLAKFPTYDITIEQ